MRLSLGQELRLVQKQVMAPRMIQSMEILQLPIMSLEERIEQAMEDNPVLEIREEEQDLPETDEEEYESASAETSGDEERTQGAEEVSGADEEAEEPLTEDERELVIDESNDEADFERLLEMGEQFPEHFEDGPRLSRNAVEEASERKHDAMANMAARPPSLQDYLHDQLSWFDLDPKLRAMADLIIYNLDSNGYLPTALDDLLGPEAGPEDRERIREALAVVQRLDPPGVGARSLKECLLLQITPGMPYYEELKRLISDHLEDLEHNRLPLISRATGYSIEKIQEVVAELRKLNPKPGADFNESYVPAVTPDVFVDPVEGGGYRVRLEEGKTPCLYISPYYRKLLADPNVNPETKQYIKEKINAAQWLIDSIQQRRNTLTRVAQAIVDHQAEFLDKGPEAIEPLKMQQIADKVGVHVTTVSRAVDDKWIQTPRGIFPLRRFFVGGTVSLDGEEVAWDTVRLKLREIIDGEDKSNPYSDEQLVEELAKQGIKVARRTVTKYRKQMNIPSSRQRRDWSLAKTDKNVSS
ncbi:MAG TPA: RNA polymerase factor sigma-54 [Planctomycetaceae bacterium]|nr:RNA polymerase factor sigma-54 [Planctomycetaceae bacterium]HIQ20640.1 RNA polymerase sigma-54 factor [Planctomycetota bacterium]